MTPSPAEIRVSHDEEFKGLIAGVGDHSKRDLMIDGRLLYIHKIYAFETETSVLLCSYT